MIKPTVEIRLADLAPIRCKRGLKGSWQNFDARADACDPLAFAAGEIVIIWNGGGSWLRYDLMGKRFINIILGVVIDGREFDAGAWLLNGRGITIRCRDCSSKKKLVGARYLVNSTHNMSSDELSRFLIDKMDFTW